MPLFLEILQIVVILALSVPLAVLTGTFFARYVLEGERHVLPERLTYRLFGVDPDEDMNWKRYGLALVLSNGACMLAGYLLLRLQGFLPLNPQGLPPQDPDLAFNTMASFITNTNWQAYSGEVSLSNFTQMAPITFMMFISPASFFAAAAALIRGFTRAESEGLGNYWVDMTRVIYRFCLPLAVVVALLFVWQGEPQTLASNATVDTVEGATQEIARGPVASLSSIKHFGTNGGGFFSQNSSHPYENPTILTDVTQNWLMLLVAPSIVYAFGLLLGRKKQGWALFAACMFLLVVSVAIVYPAEQYGNPLLTSVGADQSLTADQGGGSMEGKEVKFGPSLSALFTAITTAQETGSVNNMHDSLTPIGGLVAIFNMQFGSTFGGAGAGFIYLIMYAIIAVFIVGLMVGRSPEFLGKKIEARDVSLTVLALLVTPVFILGFTGLALVWPGALDSLNNPGAHGFSEILYAYTTGTMNNGSAFEGLADDTYFYNTTVGLVMLFGRYLPVLALLAVAGSLAAKKRIPETAGTFSTATPIFAAVLVATIVLVGGLTFFPSWALGPLAEEFQMLAGKTFLLGG
jgi:potassium-transporting ATPase potassium-binding subunit